MKKKIVGIAILVVLILCMVGIKIYNDKTKEKNNVTNTIKYGVDENIDGLTTIKIATGGGKEDVLADEKVNQIIHEKYKLNPIYDGWSNGKLVVNPLVREDGSKYDLM